MEAKELRLGNLIYNGIREVFKVNAMTIGYFDISQATLGAFKPIPLTEEWLIKFGFEKNVRYGVEFTKYCKYKNFNIEVSVYLLDGKYVTGDDFEINYVHQLQSLYYALTGEELTINQ